MRGNLGSILVADQVEAEVKTEDHCSPDLLKAVVIKYSKLASKMLQYLTSWWLLHLAVTS